MTTFSFSNSDIKQQVLHFLDTLGIPPHDQNDIIIDGVRHRYRTRDDKPSQTSGAYQFYDDGLPAGWAMDWNDGTIHLWHFDTSGLSKEQQTYFNSKEFKAKAEKLRAEADAKRKEKQLAAARHAALLWDTLTLPPDDHPYLCRKNIDAYFLKFDPMTNSLAVGITDINYRILSIQWIPADPQLPKRYQPDCPLEGGMFIISPQRITHDFEGTILLGEGAATMLKVYELTQTPCVAAMSCFRLVEVAQILHDHCPKAKIIVIADNDWETMQKRDFNPGIKHADEVVKAGLAWDSIAPNFSEQDTGCSDWDDFALKFGDSMAAQTLMGSISKVLMPPKIRELMNHVDVINAEVLRSKEFPPIKWAIQGLVAEGVTILGGSPKVGKSILALNFAVGVSIGGTVLGKIDVEQGDVLYLALEDTQRRLQERINSGDFPDDIDLSNLTVVTKIPRQHLGGLSFLRWWTEQHKNARLIIIDTLQMFRKQLSGKGNMYAEDYEVIAEIKKFAEDFGVAVLLIHHLKKISKQAELMEDWINFFSGSQGIAGSADTLFTLTRTRDSKEALLHRTGRDVEEKSFTLHLDRFGWILDGEVGEFTLSDWERQIKDYLVAHDTVTPAELSMFYNIPVKTAQKNLSRALKKGLVAKSGYGKYALRQ